MKKYLFSLLLFTVCTLINAENVKVEIEAAKAQAGSTTKLNVMLTTDVDLAGLTFYVKLPSSATVTSVMNDGVSEPNITFEKSGVSIASFESDGRLSYGIASATNIFSASSVPVKIATIEIKAPEDIDTYEMVVSRIGYANSDFTIDVAPSDDVTYETALTVQKTAVIDEMSADNNIEIIPFSLTKGTNENEIQLLMTNTNAIGNVEFDMYLPEGITWSLEDGDPMEAELDNYNSAPNQNIEENEDGSMHVQFYRSASKYYFNAGLKAAPIATIYLDAASDLEDGVYTIKLKNIVLDEKTAGDSYTGEYYTSVIVGQPKAQEVILYGNYSSSVANEFQNAFKNEKGEKHVALVDLSAATVAEDAKFQDVIVSTKGGSYYTRTFGNYATTVLPYELQESPNAKLYTVKEMSEEDGITLEETDYVAANTPCIFKGTITATGESVPTLDGDAIDGQGVATITFTGTYELTELIAGAGYYISGGAFYNDGASINPFRAYFDGAIAGVKSFSVKIDTPNGLIDITDQLSDEAIYSLQGIRMSNAQKGINIKGGKKVYVK